MWTVVTSAVFTIQKNVDKFVFLNVYLPIEDWLKLKRSAVATLELGDGVNVPIESLLALPPFGLTLRLGLIGSDVLADME